MRTTITVPHAYGKDGLIPAISFDICGAKHSKERDREGGCCLGPDHTGDHACFCYGPYHFWADGGALYHLGADQCRGMHGAPESIFTS